MEIKTIYEHIGIDTPGTYQIKVKGELARLNSILRSYHRSKITSETADVNHPIYMIELPHVTQSMLFELVNSLLRYNYPIISVMCIQITAKKTKNQHNDDDSPFAITA